MRWLVLFAGFLTGCFYYNGRNHAPELTLSTPSAPAARCSSLSLDAPASDAEGDAVSYRWAIRVVSTETATAGKVYWLKKLGANACPLAALEEQLLEQAEPVWLEGGAKLPITHLPIRGHYQVRVEASDDLKATREATGSFEVVNARPSISDLRLDRDPEMNNYTIPDVTGGYPAHGHYYAWIAAATDSDDDLRCSSGRKIRWEPVGRPLQDMEYWQELPCTAQTPPLGALRFRLKPELAKAGPLGVRVTLTDAEGGEGSAEKTLTTVVNRPPCIGATEPYFYDKALKVPVLEPNTFRASFVSNDVPEPLEFTWMVKDSKAASWSLLAVQLTDSLSSVTLPELFRPPGSVLTLRVAVREVGGPAPQCDESVQLCPCDEVKQLPNQKACYRWVTWTLEFL